jgi:hypothetical protein
MKAMTAFGKKLVALRNKAISKGMKLMTEDEIIDFDLWQRLKESEDIKNEDWKKMREEKLSSVELLMEFREKYQKAGNDAILKLLLKKEREYWIEEGKKLQRIEDERTTP